MDLSNTPLRKMWRAFTLIESLIVVAILGILLAVLAPVLARSRGSAREVVSLANARGIAAAVGQYGAENRDMPPVLFDPIESYEHKDPPQEVEVYGRQVRGRWFYNGWEFHKLLNPVLPADALLAPGSVPHDIVDVGGIGTVNVADYSIPYCLYASSDYWNRWTQRGPSQWGAQRFSSISFPADKGLVRQHTVYGLANFPYEQSASGFRGVRSAVAWADHSAATVVQVDLNPGEPNFYYHNGTRTFLDSGLPIEETLAGVRGRDKAPYQPARPPKAGSKQPTDGITFASVR